MSTHLVLLSGAGLSAPSGLATFRGQGGLWDGHRVEEVATPEAWSRHPDLVLRFYAARRQDASKARPNPGHHALARLQRHLGPDRVTLVTQNVDGLLEAAGALQVLDMHGSLWRGRCAHHPHHPRPRLPPEGGPTHCQVCGAPLRPDIVWFGEVPHHLPAIDRALARATLFVAVGTSGTVYPAAGLGQRARALGAHTLEINPEPSRAPWFEQEDARGAEAALPEWVDRWIEEG